MQFGKRLLFVDRNCGSSFLRSLGLEISKLPEEIKLEAISLIVEQVVYSSLHVLRQETSVVFGN
jgi:hypothetical protein